MSALFFVIVFKKKLQKSVDNMYYMYYNIFVR